MDPKKRPSHSAVTGVILGLCLGLLNAAGWTAFIRSSVPLDVELPGVYDPRPPQTQLKDGHYLVDLDTCSHCPRFALLNRGVLGGYAPIHYELLAALNAPALYATAGESLRFGVRIVRPMPFFLLSSLQWIALGYLAYWWRTKRLQRGEAKASG